MFSGDSMHWISIVWKAVPVSSNLTLETGQTFVSYLKLHHSLLLQTFFYL